jgi:hypothetical protein
VTAELDGGEVSALGNKLQPVLRAMDKIRTRERIKTLIFILFIEILIYPSSYNNIF